MHFRSDCQNEQNHFPIRLKEVLFLALIISTGLDTTPFFNLHFGPLQISMSDFLLSLLMYIIVADLAVGNDYPAYFSLKMAKLIFAAGTISLINLMYVGGDYVMFDIKVSLKLFEHALLIFITSYVIVNFFILKRSLQVLCVVSLCIATLIIMQSLGILHFHTGLTRRTTLQLGPFLIGTYAVADGAMGVALLMLSSFPFMTSKFVFSSLAFRMAATSMIIMASIITFSRNLWLSIFFEAILLFIVHTARLRTSYLKLFSLLLFSIAGIFFLFNVDKLYSMLIHLRPSTVAQRENGYASAFSLVFSEPLYLLFGAGKGAFFQMQVFAHNRSIAHNLFLDVLVSKGLVVLILIIGFLTTLIVKIYSARCSKDDILNYINLIAILGVISESMFAPCTNSINFWLLMAITCSMISIEKNQ